LVYQFIAIENDSNFITMAQFVKKRAVKKVSNDEPFVKSNLVRYKSHNTTSIPKQFIRKDIHHQT